MGISPWNKDVSMSEDAKKKNSESRIGKQKGKNKNSSSKYLGVCFHKSNKWVCNIRYYNKSIYIGLFSSEEDAALAYNNMASKLYGENAVLNIII
jgi:hypothetical protein